MLRVEGHHRRSGILSVDAVHLVAQITQICQALLQVYDCLSRTAEIQRTEIIGSGRVGRSVVYFRSVIIIIIIIVIIIVIVIIGFVLLIVSVIVIRVFHFKGTQINGYMLGKHAVVGAEVICLKIHFDLPGILQRSAAPLRILVGTQEHDVFGLITGFRIGIHVESYALDRNAVYRGVIRKYANIVIIVVGRVQI